MMQTAAAAPSMAASSLQMDTMLTSVVIGIDHCSRSLHGCFASTVAWQRLLQTSVIGDAGL